ncbi:hypothetical protein [Yimella lutea]|uniref:hypothetical protein n=1 Tax=Yimella lutea TaxID=587872 RepID=UPI00114E7313|nr:hypothetical protein [Yimella lutea]
MNSTPSRTHSRRYETDVRCSSPTTSPVYLRGHEGRGVGLPVDAREYAAAAAILHSLDICDVRLISNNPAKRLGLQDNGIEVGSMEPSPVRVSDHNLRYLQTKRDRMGHDLPDLHEGATV